MASYISEEKIRRREIVLLRNEELDAVRPSTDPSTSSNTVVRSSRKVGSPAQVRKCVICGNIWRNKTDNKLFLCSELAAAQCIFDKSREKQDRVFTETSTCETATDLFAIEIRYHKSCYRDYVRPSREQRGQRGRPTNMASRENIDQSIR